MVTINSGESVTDTVVVSGSKGVATGHRRLLRLRPDELPAGLQQRRHAASAMTSHWPAVRPSRASSRRPPSRAPGSPTTTASASSTRPRPGPSTSPTSTRTTPPNASRSSRPTCGSSSPRTPARPTPVSRSRFILQWGNVGEGKATGVVVTDSLPGNSGLNWSIVGSTGTGSTCSIAGAVGSAGPDLQRRLDQRQHAGDPGRCRRQHPEQRLGDRHERDDAGLLRRHQQHRRHHVDQRRHQPEPRSDDRPVPGRQRRRRRRMTARSTPAMRPRSRCSCPMPARVRPAGLTLTDPLPAGLTWALGTVTGNTDGVTCRSRERRIAGPVLRRLEPDDRRPVVHGHRDDDDLGAPVRHLSQRRDRRRDQRVQRPVGHG